jgi:hypothetical protein
VIAQLKPSMAMETSVVALPISLRPGLTTQEQ